MHEDGHFPPAHCRQEADPLTVRFIEKALDAEKLGLVVFTGDQLHRGIPDSPAAFLKLLAPATKRKAHQAVVFGNHDDEGAFSLSRKCPPV
jgi:3',5'-cyclic AMP phosphodiesterase CpdA